VLGCAATLSMGVPFLLIAVAQRAMSTPAMAAVRVVLAAATLVLVLAPTGTVSVMLATPPLWIAVGAVLTRSGERFGTQQWIAAPLALVGVQGCHAI
jgi:drug/metabolite transporter (DMT)-like permease